MRAVGILNIPVVIKNLEIRTEQQVWALAGTNDCILDYRTRRKSSEDSGLGPECRSPSVLPIILLLIFSSPRLWQSTIIICTKTLYCTVQLVSISNRLNYPY